MKTLLIICVIVLALVALFLWGKSKARSRGDAALQTRRPAAAEPPPRDVRSLLAPLLRPTILIHTTPDVASSYFGGLPPRHDGFQWPQSKGRPMEFLACMDLAQMPPTFDWLPKEGRLLFFYDMEEQPWGFDPEDRGGWAVLYVPEPLTPDTPRAELPNGWRPDKLLKTRGICFREAELPPSWEESAVESLQFTEAENEELAEWRGSLQAEEADHHIGGYADPIQDVEMALQCQLVSQGLYCGNSSGYQDPSVARLASGAADWELLFQMDSDDDLDIMWGDLGRIYFWVRKEDAKRGDFSQAWLVLQCH